MKGQFRKKSQLFSSIFEDSQMSSQFVMIEDNTESFQLLKIQQSTEEEVEDTKISKNNQSRLQIQIRKNKINFNPIQGQCFILSSESYLEGKNGKQSGLIMMTNYRMLFFKQGNRRVDLPFGFIQNIQYNDKMCRVIFYLKYPHNWKFYVTNSTKYVYLKNFIMMYFKPTLIASFFAFQYFKVIQQKFEEIDYLGCEYKRLRMYQRQNFKAYCNIDFNLNSSYPKQIFTAYVSNINILAKHKKNKRFPILSGVVNNQNKRQAFIWISSSYQQLKNIDKQIQTAFLKQIGPVSVFAVQAKQSKAIDQSYFDKSIKINYLKCESNQEIKGACLKFIQIFLVNKDKFIKQLLSSKWLHIVSNVLKYTLIIRNSLYQINSTIIRCQSGKDISLVLTALIQITMDPYYRTYQGFQTLVMRIFVFSGHPFRQRLSNSANGQSSPIFILFLDCVSQLISNNLKYFQYNSKYLSKIANLMYTNIYGTFLANSPKQYYENKIGSQTVSIWKDILTPITTNSFYCINNGIINIPSDISSLRIWKQYFGSLVTKNKDYYKLQQNAQENNDYPNLMMSKIHEQNMNLKKKLAEQYQVIQKLKKQIQNKKQ